MLQRIKVEEGREAEATQTPTVRGTRGRISTQRPARIARHDGGRRITPISWSDGLY